MKKLINEWIEENPISEDLYWKGPARNQINYVRDEIASGLLGAPCYVISQHCSKSVRLPVYQINYKGLEIIMRDNFYGWIVSLKSELPLLLDQDLIYYDSGMDEKEEKIPSCYCEGFVEEWIYPKYTDLCTECTFRVGGKYELWTLLYLLRKYYDNKKILVNYNDIQL